jgi:PadR family transcriptional regulator, regulatory protein AphA
MHGYEIYQRLSQPAELWQVWRLKQSQLYALLTKLEEEQYLIATLQPQDARPPRKIYSLTEAGRAAFQHWLTTPVAHGRQMRLEFLAKLYFAYRQPPWLAELREKAPSAAEAQPFAYAVHQFRLSQIEAFLAWITTCRQTLPAAVDLE